MEYRGMKLTKNWNLDHGIVEGKRGKFKLDFRPWHGGRQFFSVQRLHGFRQVVQHVQLHVAKIGLINELKHTHGRLRIEGPQE